MNWLQKTAQQDLMQEPGTLPVPPGHIRLYHYLPRDQVENVRQQGIDIGQARGETYGEPNAVWGSTRKPSDNHTFVEFSVSTDDPSWFINKPDTPEHAQEFQNSGSDATFGRTIMPNEFIAIHEPWHNRYRYLMNDPQLLQEVQHGKFDHLLDNEEYGPAILKAKESSNL
jgi:hypothetical protein